MDKSKENILLTSVVWEFKNDLQTRIQPVEQSGGILQMMEELLKVNLLWLDVYIIWRFDVFTGVYGCVIHVLSPIIQYMFNSVFPQTIII